jgi:hypothetical protein
MRAFLCAWALLIAAGARADEPAHCKISMVHALEGNGGVDPKLERLKPYFEKPPFTSWKQFKLLDEKSLEVKPGAPAEFKLPNGKDGSLTYVDHLLQGQGKHRLRLKLAISDAGKKVLETVIVLDEGGVFLQAGQKMQQGLLVLAFSCLTGS